ncbi:M15 family metallopeptidase [Pseudarthrobacter oxydans]|uniref:M15 family metallopeptidase n=1 Tax=Pseudarthrobacter oxydans TaxID=1671 RepID=UPI0031B5BA0B
MTAASEPITPSSDVDPTGPLMLVTKDLPLPDGYVPADLVHPNVPSASPGAAPLLNAATAAAAEAMFAAARADGVAITLVSGYRSFTTQAIIREGHTSALGAEAAEAVSARPGHSEHQTGWAMDIGDGSGTCSMTACFADQPAAAWAAANAHLFGFIIRYPPGAEHITGYVYEPWHLRYVGVGPATEIAARGITLEEYLGSVAG